MKQTLCTKTGILFDSCGFAMPEKQIFLKEHPLADYGNARIYAQQSRKWLLAQKKSVSAGAFLTLLSHYGLASVQSALIANEKISRCELSTIVDAVLFVENHVNSGSHKFIPALSFAEAFSEVVFKNWLELASGLAISQYWKQKQEPTNSFHSKQKKQAQAKKTLKAELSTMDFDDLDAMSVTPFASMPVGTYVQDEEQGSDEFLAGVFAKILADDKQDNEVAERSEAQCRNANESNNNSEPQTLSSNGENNNNENIADTKEQAAEVYAVGIEQAMLKSAAFSFNKIPSNILQLLH